MTYFYIIFSFVRKYVQMRNEMVIALSNMEWA